MTMRPLSPTLAKIAEEELNETPQRVQQDLVILRDWINQQKHLRARSSDEFLIAFLRRCQYSLEETKNRIEKFFKFYSIAPEFFQHRCVNERILDINRLGVHFYPEYPKCNNQRALLISRFGHVDYSRYIFREILIFETMAMEIIAMESDNAAIAGICLIVDLAGVELDQVDRLLFRKWMDWIDDCCPVQIKETYFINPSKDLERIFNWKKIWMKTPLVFKSQNDLYDYVPRECLPEEYGGSNGHLGECVAYMEDLLKSYRSYFQEDEYLGVLEDCSQRQEVVTYESGFSLYGSFRKLDEE